MTAPKLFVSYSWSNAEHEQWVIELATSLRNRGIDVILDKWELREGHDAIAFMEKMVTDSEIKKVVMIIDRKYVEKADGRDGGVGTETQIISKEVYENQEQGKFVAVVAERDENGRVCLPAYYKSRIYIDLSDEASYSDNYEKLERWVWDKPLDVKPEIGKAPEFFDGEDNISLGTTPSYRRAFDAVKNSKAFASGALDEYFEIFSRNLESFRLDGSDGEFDDKVIANIAKFTPYRDEAIRLFSAISRYSPSIETAERIHKFFESLIHYMDRPENVTSWNDCDFDNFLFILHELFLYAIAIFLRFEKFEMANFLLAQRYYIPRNAERGLDVMCSYTIFRKHMKSLVYRNQRLKKNRLSLRADVLHERCAGTGINFMHLMQADFVLYLRSQIERLGGNWPWWPETLLYSDRLFSPFEIFARSSSRGYFDRVKCLLAINDPNDLKDLMANYSNNTGNLPNWEHVTPDPAVLLGYDKLAKAP